MSLPTSKQLRCGLLLAGAGLFCLAAIASSAQQPDSHADVLRYVVTVQRHGVRSPTGKVAQYSEYAAAPWPEWPVAPGYLTPHGFAAIRLMGAYDRLALSSQGLIHATGCDDAKSVTIYADSDQRTRETGNALAHGMFPGCAMMLLGNGESINDPLFHRPAEDTTSQQAALELAAVRGRIGDNPAGLAEAYHDQLSALDHVLGTCGTPSTGLVAGKKRVSIFDVPANLGAGNGEHAAQLRGPLTTASTLTEILLLEYTEGMPPNNVGWGCVDGANLRSLIGLHTAASDFAQRTPTVGAIQAASLLRAIVASLQQAATHIPVKDAPGKPTDKALYLIGHDTNLSNLAGALNVDWLLDGRRDDTPPGSSLAFELWQSVPSGAYSVRVSFSAQTLEQMRFAQPLTLASPPPRVSAFVPGCSRADLSCPLSSFTALIQKMLRTDAE